MSASEDLRIEYADLVGARRALLQFADRRQLDGPMPDSMFDLLHAVGFRASAAVRFAEELAAVIVREPGHRDDDGRVDLPTVILGCLALGQAIAGQLPEDAA